MTALMSIAPRQTIAQTISSTVMNDPSGQGILSESFLLPVQWQQPIRRPEHALLRAVLEEAVGQAQKIPKVLISPQAIAHVKELRRWFCEDQPSSCAWSLGEICDHLGLEIGRIRRIVLPFFPKETILNPTPRRNSNRKPGPPLSYNTYRTKDRWHTRLFWYPRKKYFSSVQITTAREKTIRELHGHGIRGNVRGYEAGVQYTLFVPETLLWSRV
jgi:hypothetical protein